LQRRLGGRTLLILPPLLLVLVFFGWPVSRLLLRSVSDPVWGLQNYEALLHSPVYGLVLWNTIAISGTVTLLCLLLGYPLAYAMARAGPRMRRLLIFIVLLPFWTSVLVRTFAWMVLLQRNGIVNKTLIETGLISDPLRLIYNRTGVLIGMTHVLLPFMVLPLYAVMQRIDPNYGAAASSLGAPPVQSFFRVYLPLSMPGVVTGCVLVFVSGLGYYITPALLGGPGDLMLAQIIETQVAEFGRWGCAGALAVVLLGATALAFGLLRRAMIDPQAVRS
jgi:putative spermidine/putrescine transport system permease protein